MDVLTAAVLALGAVLFGAILVAGRILSQRTAPLQPESNPITAPESEFSELRGQIAAIERRQSDLEGEVSKKLARATARQRRAEAALQDDVDQEGQGPDLPDPSQLQLPVPDTAGHATLDQVRARARARRQS